MSDYSIQRTNMVESQVRPGNITDRRLIRALSHVPREIFVPQELAPLAYMEGPLMGRTAAGAQRCLLPAPRTFAKLLDLAEIGDRNTVLDIGGAMGYPAAVLAHMAGRVVALECDAHLAAGANERLAALGLTNVTVVTGNLEEGYPAGGPYDVIVVEGAIFDLPENWISQLSPGGRLVAVQMETGEVGRGTVWRRFDGAVGRYAAFDAAAPVLPGFEKKTGFVF